MLLAIDIGNTNISFGFFKGHRMIKRFDISTKSYNLKKIRGNLSKLVTDEIIICSVVPEICKFLEKDLKLLLRRSPWILGKDIKVPIKNLYRRPQQVGQDRLVNAFAGIKLYGAPLIVVDFGTAVTFDVISKNNEYVGGMILPGLEISLDALNQGTALLPKIRLNRPQEFIGRDTRNSILSGLIHGYGCLVDSLTKKIKNRIGKTAKVIGTGGNIDLMGRYCEALDKRDRDLTLKGLEFIYTSRHLRPL